MLRRQAREAAADADREAAAPPQQRRGRVTAGVLAGAVCALVAAVCTVVALSGWLEHVHAEYDLRAMLRVRNGAACGSALVHDNGEGPESAVATRPMSAEDCTAVLAAADTHGRRHVPGPSMGDVLLAHAPDGRLRASGAGVRAYTEHGRPVLHCGDVRDAAADGLALSLVPPGRPWMLPRRPAGSRVRVAHMGPFTETGEPVVVEHVHEVSPRVFVLHNLFSDREADRLVAQARHKVQRSTVGAIAQKALDRKRTSHTTFDQGSREAVALKRRITALLGMEYREAWLDGIQMVRYDVGQAYNEHKDTFEAYV